MVGFELSGAEPAWLGLVEKELVVELAMVHRRQREQRLFWGVEGSQFQQALGLPVARRAQLALRGQRWHSCWLR